MRIKIILTLILPGFLYFNAISADNNQRKNLKDQAARLTETENPALESSLSSQDEPEVLSVFDESDEVYLPFGKSSKSMLPSAVTIINPEDLLMYNSIHDVSSAITGYIPGTLGGTNIRGLGNAVVLIDGVPRPMTSVNIEEIEQITVLKDANASVLYGVQANQGIILITTKRGKVNERKVNISVEQGLSSPLSLPKYLGSAEYMELYNEARRNDGLTDLYTQDQINNTKSGNNPTRYPDVDYYSSDFLKSFKPLMRFNADFRTGGENAQYYLNVGYLRNGTLLNQGDGALDNDQRLNIRSNLNFKINNFMKSYVDLVAIWDISHRVTGDYWSDASTLRPNLFPPLIDTALLDDNSYVSTANLINGKYMAGGRTDNINNVYANMHLGGYSNQINTSVQFTNGIEFDLKGITRGLRLNTLLSFDFYNMFTESQTNTYAVYQTVWSSDDKLSLNKIGTDVYSGSKNISDPFLAKNIGTYAFLDYSRTFNDKHALWATLAAYGEYATETEIYQSNKKSHLGLRLNYAYNNKYVVDFSSALVSSTKLHPDNRRGLSPSIAAAWILSEEGFLKDNSFIDFLKLKASVSNIKTDLTIPDYFLYEGSYSGGGTFYWLDGKESLSSVIMDQARNYNLFYQIRKDLNVGLEMVLAKSIFLDANVFSVLNANQIVQLSNTYPTFLGGPSPYENYGEDKYTGFEVGATWKKQVNNNFRFEIGANVSRVKSEVIKRDERWEWDYQYRVGKPVSAMYGLEAVGLFSSDADIASHAYQAFGTVRPGDIKYKDQNNDGVIDANDEIMLGQSDPNLYGGLHLMLSYKNFSIFALATGRTGADRYSSSSYYWVYGDMKYSEVVRDRWTQANAANALYPRLTSQSSSNNFRSSSFWLYDNSMIRIDRLQLAYNLPGAVSSKLLMKGLNLYLRASNLATLSQNKDKIELNVGSEPQYRYYAVGIKAIF